MIFFSPLSILGRVINITITKINLEQKLLHQKQSLEKEQKIKSEENNEKFQELAGEFDKACLELGIDTEYLQEQQNALFKLYYYNGIFELLSDNKYKFDVLDEMQQDKLSKKLKNILDNEIDTTLKIEQVISIFLNLDLNVEQWKNFLYSISDIIQNLPIKEQYLKEYVEEARKLGLKSVIAIPTDIEIIYSDNDLELRTKNIRKELSEFIKNKPCNNVDKANDLIVFAEQEQKGNNIILIGDSEDSSDSEFEVL